MEPRPKLEVKKGPLPPEQYRANNAAVFQSIRSRTELDPAHPDHLRLFPVTLRALEIYTTSIALVPRGAGDYAGMLDFYQSYTHQFNENSANKQKISCMIDDASNVYLRMKASGGKTYEEMPEIDWQGHYDMVCEAQNGYRDPAEYGVALELVNRKNKRTGEDQLWLKGQETSSGIDCGWGIAWTLANLEAISQRDDNHPAIGVIVTRDEEVGLLGAKAFSFTQEQLTGSQTEYVLPRERYLLNVDNVGKEGMMEGLIGSAGLAGATISLNVDRVAIPSSMSPLLIDVLGTQAGHSGVDRDRIGNGRWNKITVALELLQQLQENPVLNESYLIGIRGGHADNAIPMNSQVILAVPEGKEEEVLTLFQQYVDQKNQQAQTDLARFQEQSPQKAEEDETDVITVKRGEEPEEGQYTHALSRESTTQLLQLLSILSDPEGVMRIEWEHSDPQAVETSSNLSEIFTHEENVDVIILTRSSQRDKLHSETGRPAEIRKAVEEIGAYYTTDDDQVSDPWTPDLTDPIVGIQLKAGKGSSKVTTIHAGVEVKTLQDKFRNIFGEDYVLHATSHGPAYKEEHSFEERGLVKSFEVFSEFESNLYQEILAYELDRSSGSRRKAA